MYVCRGKRNSGLVLVSTYSRVYYVDAASPFFGLLELRPVPLSGSRSPFRRSYLLFGGVTIG